jgi:hypothetical protein
MQKNPTGVPRALINFRIPFLLVGILSGLICITAWVFAIVVLQPAQRLNSFSLTATQNPTLTLIATPWFKEPIIPTIHFIEPRYPTYRYNCIWVQSRTGPFQQCYSIPVFPSATDTPTSTPTATITPTSTSTPTPTQTPTPTPALFSSTGVIAGVSVFTICGCFVALLGILVWMARQWSKSRTPSVDAPFSESADSLDKDAHPKF